MRIGILGGTFNPLHNGHVNLAKVFLSSAELDKLILLPACVPPHKQAPDLAGTRTRLEFCHAVTSIDSRVQVSDYEIINGGVNYTANTLEFFHKLYPEDDLFFLVGTDMFLTLHQWVDPPRIFKNATICVTYRYGGDEERTLREYARDTLGITEDQYILAPCEPVEVSSTEIRQMVARGEDISHLVPPGVLDIITKEELYRDR